MADTAASQIHADIVVYGTPIVKWGALAANTYKPGDWLYESSDGTYTKVDGDTVATKVVKPVLLLFEPRINLSTKARLDVDDTYEDQTTAYAPICIGNAGPGPLVIVGRIEDPGGSVLRFQRWNVGTTTAGVLEVANTTDQGAGYVQVNVTNLEGIVDNSTYALFLWE
jgi:hypothetical protein